MSNRLLLMHSYYSMCTHALTHMHEEWDNLYKHYTDEHCSICCLQAQDFGSTTVTLHTWLKVVVINMLVTCVSRTSVFVLSTTCGDRDCLQKQNMSVTYSSSDIVHKYKHISLGPIQNVYRKFLNEC